MFRTPTILTAAAVALGLVAPQTDLTPKEIIERVDRVMRGDSSHGVSQMNIVTEHWERELVMEMWSMGTDYSLIRVRSPAREAGTATLMADKDIWNYLPKVDRTIKIPTSMMSGAWMGSHFTNDDLVKESQLIEDFDVELTFDGERDGVTVWEFRLTPKPEVAVVWGHIDYRVRQSDYMPLWARYFDEDEELARTMRFSEFKDLGGRTVPTVMDVIPADKPNERTRVIYESIEFDIDLDRSFFSLQTLQRRR
ncbi:MAG: outer membrane lipoprotein-sorting protein [Acidobacteria bacterium]|nr:outer membrane lipoprotein-sorting protein [Acidobacteriota bacterium]